VAVADLLKNVRDLYILQPTDKHNWNVCVLYITVVASRHVKFRSQDLIILQLIC